ncbi:MAG TPA: hypothetical protein VG273_19040 [Bryobacteraceae bacterium]|jgi:hypothetical protein|nr:hypothetical protein [Bryobacteraceae bacterium]
MKTSLFVYAVTGCLWVACAGVAAGQSDMRGHWSGTLETPGGPLVMEVDLDKPASGWIGSISIPAQGAEGLPLGTVSFTGGKAAFHIKSALGDPAFTGALSADGKTLDGTFTQGTASLPLKFSRNGDAMVVLPKTSTAVTAQFLGTWEGKIDAGPGLRIVLKISNGKSGAEASMASPDQGNVPIPVSAVVQTGSKLNLEVNAIGGGYVAEINKEGTQLKGTWTQTGNSIELVLTKTAGSKP